ncbi:hypothetical protein ACIBSV_49280 [Embleya sp. NPDC050154]|uniref:hypothetical protein n=1 Tax=Embleya sp. NPDC050154 TaxID=3363988 RepID=UPI0037AB3171
MKEAIRNDTRTLSSGQENVWEPIAAQHGISTFGAKYLYTTGLLREHMSVSGLAFRNRVYLGSVFSALIAAELVGHCVAPATGAGLRLRNGLHYLEATCPKTDGEYITPVEDLVSLRNFVAHGAFNTKGASLSTATTTYLLHRLALATDKLWIDTTVHESFKKSDNTPLKVGEECIYIADMLRHVDTGKTPGQDVDNEEAWRFTTVSLPTGSPGITGTG